MPNIFNRIKNSYVPFIVFVLFSSFLHLHANSYTIPAEWDEQESVWLQWPHNQTYGNYLKVNKVEPVWVEMVKALHTTQKINIICLNTAHKDRIKKLLKAYDTGTIAYHVTKINDVWIRDNGPVYAKNKNDENIILDWIFNGWGDKIPKQFYLDDDKVPAIIGNSLGVSVVAPQMVLEGGSIEINGRGTLMATRLSIINDNRNPGMSQQDIEKQFATYAGATNIIWLEGAAYEDPDIGGDITDGHIDGLARFIDDTTILYSWCAEDENDPWFTRIIKKNKEILENSYTESGKKWRLIPLLETAAPVGEYAASYTNFLIANRVILFPIFNDSNDVKAVETVSKLFPTHTIAPINCTELYTIGGGMIHCITQTEPRKSSVPNKTSPLLAKSDDTNIIKLTKFGNISFKCMIADTYSIVLFNNMGKKLVELENRYFRRGKPRILLKERVFASGIYILKIKGSQKEHIAPILF